MGELRKLLFPFAILYGLITFVRNKMFDWGLISIYEIPVKAITVGNLSVGGTGKTPHVAFLASIISKSKKTSILSRGYGRKTKGYFQVNKDSTALSVGDEPLQYFTQLSPDISVVVCESRTEGVKKILEDIQPDVILLDDAFQHRKVHAEFSILLMDYSKPFYTDFMLPAGDLREFTFGKKRADRLIVTKCPNYLSNEAKKKISIKSGFSEKQIYYSSIEYGKVIRFDNQVFNGFNEVLLVTGIANPKPLYQYLQETNKVELVAFTDHHPFSVSDIQKIHTKFDLLEDTNAVILTTEKDFMRLKSIVTKNELERYPWCYIPIRISLDREAEFVQEIKNYVDTI